MDFLVGLFIIGLLLWWIIKSDLEKRDFQKKCNEENKKRDAQQKEDDRAHDQHIARMKAWHYRKTTHLKRCQEQCRDAQNAEGLLPIEIVGRILGWSAFVEIRGVFSGDDCYAADHDEHPFPKELRSGFFRASDLINWLDEEDREQQSNFHATYESAH